MVDKPTYEELERRIRELESAASELKHVETVLYESEEGTIEIHNELQDRKQAEEKLLESEERFKTLSNLTFEGILTHNNGVIIDSNSSAAKMLGYTKEELIGENIIQLCIPHEYHASIKENIIKNFAKPYEVMAKRKNGTVFPLEIEAKDIKEGNEIFRVAAIRDITERKQSEGILKKSEQELKSIFRAAPTGIGVVCDRVIQQANDRFCEITGYSRNEVVGQNARILYPSDEESEYVGREKYFQINKKGTGTVETKWRCKDGEIIDVLLSSTPIDLDDLSKGVTFTALDITYLKTKELQLLESEKKYKTIMESMKEPLYIGSHDFIIQYMNPAMIKRTGHDATGKNCFKAIHDLDKKCPWCQYEEVLDGNSLELDIVSPKDNHSFHISITPIVNNDGSISSLNVLRDVTEFKKMEVQVQQTQKMESIGTLAGGIAHDFNNILFPIVGHTEMLIEDVPADSPFKESLNQIYTSALRARELVKQILTFSRQENSDLKLMKMQPIIKEALKLIRSTIPTTIEIKQNIQPDCGVVKANPTQIHQIVMNLSTNAYHAMENEGGELKVVLKEVELSQQDLIYDDLTPGGYACLTVSDTGIGISKDGIDKIFDPFFTTKEKGKGTGMGLSVVHGIIKTMGGGIVVDSELGKGTEFNVYLPIAKSAFKAEESPIKESILGGDERILLVDDEEIILKMEKQALERLGYRIASCNSSIEALEAFKACPDKFDLVITDIAMPKMPGDKLAVEVIKIRPDIPILLCTGFSDTMTEEKIKSLGIKGLLLKPIIIKDLARKIREVLDAN